MGVELGEGANMVLMLSVGEYVAKSFSVLELHTGGLVGFVRPLQYVVVAEREPRFPL